MNTFEGHTREVRSLVVSNEGHLISGADKDSIKILNIKTGEILKSFKLRVFSLAITKEGQLISGAEGDPINVWEKVNQKYSLFYLVFVVLRKIN